MATKHLTAQRKRGSPCMFPAQYGTVTRGVLTLIHAVSSKVEDAGLYTCLASSPAGEDGKNHWVRVQGDTGCSCSAWKQYLIPPPYYFLSGTGDLVNSALCKLRSEDLRFHWSGNRLGPASGFPLSSSSHGAFARRERTPRDGCFAFF